jgi:hypothetical protein
MYRWTYSHLTKEDIEREFFSLSRELRLLTETGKDQSIISHFDDFRDNQDDSY